MNTGEVYEMVKRKGEDEFGKEGKGFVIAQYPYIVWERSTLEKRFAEDYKEVGDLVDLEKECVIDSWETWYLIDKVTKEVELFCEESYPIRYFERRLFDNPNLELYGYWAGDMIMTKYER